MCGRYIVTVLLCNYTDWIDCFHCVFMCNNHENVCTIVITGIHACLQETLNTQSLATIVETLKSINSVTVGEGLKTTQYFPVGLGLACSNIEVPPVHDDRHIPVLPHSQTGNRLGTRLIDSSVHS